MKGQDMKRRIFTEEERLELEKNPNILKVLNSNVEFCEEFKSRVVREHDEEGKSAKQIFAEAGIPDWLNSGDYAKDNMKRWRRISKRKDTPKRGRPALNMNKPISEMSLEELRRRVAYLELENEFLKKLEPLEQYKNKN